MELDFALLADAADVSMGKLYVMGGAFDTIHVQQIPAIHPVLAVVVRLLLSPNDLDRQHKLQVLLLNADGKHLASANGELTVPKAPNAPLGWKQAVMLPLRFMNLTFQEAGHYSVEILVDDNLAKAIPLRVLVAPQQSPQA